ncbi:MAG: hypothetical protein HFJ20_05880 [Clostridia bacterium]|nr:hypothetical protein [Clostridia bacterium]
MNLYIEILKFIIYSLLIVVISKYILVKLLRKLAESLELSPKAVGNIAGVATSVPEFLTVSFSAFAGFIGTSAYNILSSNVINLLQYIFSIYLNKNQKSIQNKAIKIDLVMVAITIIIPILMLVTKLEFNISIVPIFILLFIFFYYINSNVHKLYLKKQDTKLSEEIIEESKKIRGRKTVVTKYIIYLLVTAIGLYIVGNSLSNVLTNLCNTFNIPEIFLGVALGFITSLPELITFFESQKHYKNENSNELGVIEATNNLLTSNILNLFVIQTIGIIIYTIFG